MALLLTVLVRVSDCSGNIVRLGLTLYGHSGPLYSNTVIGTVHWPLMCGLLHLVQRGGAWAGCGPAHAVPSSLYQL